MFSTQVLKYYTRFYYLDQPMYNIHINMNLPILNKVTLPGRPRRRWEDNIKMDLKEVGCGGHGLDRTGSG